MPKHFFTHVLLILGILIMGLPIYVAFVASTETSQALMHHVPWLPGSHFVANYKQVLMQGLAATGNHPLWEMLERSFIMAMLIAVGKIVFSLMSAYALVFFRFPFRQSCFWLIFMTLMLPVEVRIVPTFQVVARLDMLNSYAGLTLPLIASATATFLFRQFFLTLPDELVEAARMDCAGPWHFFKDILLPLSKTNIAALFVIMFIYGWNQYLWPLVITTKGDMVTVVMGMQRLASVADQIPQWNTIMTMAILALLPPVIIVLVMQRWFVKGLVEVEK